MDDRQIGNKQKTVSHIKDVQIEELEKILNQSVRGIHHLFEKEKIAQILKTPTEELNFFTVENMTIIQKLFDELIQKKTIQEKQAYIERLNDKNFEILLRTYFHIVDSTIMTSEHVKH